MTANVIKPEIGAVHLYDHGVIPVPVDCQRSFVAPQRLDCVLDLVCHFLSLLLIFYVPRVILGLGTSLWLHFTSRFEICQYKNSKK